MGDMPKGASHIPKGEEWEWFVGALCFIGMIVAFCGLETFVIMLGYKLILGVWHP